MAKEKLRTEYGELTTKQQSAVDVLVNIEEYDTMQNAAEDAGVADSYMYYCRDEFEQIIEERRASNTTAFADGGHAGIECRFTEDEAFRAMRILPAGLSQVVYKAIRRHQPRDVDIDAGDSQ